MKNMLARRVISSGIIALWLIFLFFVSVPIREEIAHHYYHQIDISAELPLLTKCFSLRILGTGDYLSSNGDVFFYLFWCAVWAVPVMILCCVWRIKEPLLLTEFLLYSWISYLFFCIFSFSIALYGLFMPFLQG